MEKSEIGEIRKLISAQKRFIPAWFDDDVIWMRRAICWRSDIGVFWADRPPELLDAPVYPLGLDVDGIAFSFCAYPKTNGIN